MTFLSFLSYRWCDLSGVWHSGYPDASCNYSHIQGCNLFGSWSDCTPASKLDGIVEGTTGNDVIDYNYTGDPEGDKIDHNDALGTKSNDDLVYGYGGNDTVQAGEGHDKVYGGDGDDNLNGQNGNDTLFGDAGNDTLSGGADCNALDGGAGDDKFVGGAGSDTFTGGAGQDNLDYSASTSGVTVNLATGVLSGGDAANDHVASGIDGVIGSNAADSLTGFDMQGTSPADTFTNQFWGNGGNDTITGSGGNDQIYGGNDHDKLYGGAGDDTVEGGAGDDLVQGGLGADTLKGDTGNDTIYGDEGTASAGSPVTITLTGDNGAYSDKLFAYCIDPVTGAITNVQILTANSDVSVGCTYTYTVAPGTVMGVGIISPDGTFYSSGYGSRLSLNADGAVHTTGLGVNADGSVSIGFEDLRNLGDKDFNDVTIKVNLGTSGATFDNAHYSYTSTGTSASTDGGADVISGGDGDDHVYGGAGADTITYGSGADVVYGGDGNDNIDDAPGFDSTADASTVYGDKGDDTIWGAAGSDKLYGGDDNDQIGGESGNDLLDGGKGNDTLSGSNGDDTFMGGEGADQMTGGNDRDLFVGGNNGDVVDGAEGGNDNDTLDLRGLGALTIAYDPANPENGVVTFRDAGGNATGTLTFKNIETVLQDDNRDGYVDGTAGGDLIGPGYTDANGDKIDGNDARLPGASGNDDLVRAGDGNDTVLSGEGNDLVYAGNGNDSVDGGNGNDTLLGEAGSDTLKGGEGADSLDGGADADSLDGGNGNDTLAGGAGNDTADGGEGDDVINTAGPNAIPDATDPNPNDDKDVVNAGNGNDTVSTGDDADVITAGAGNDSVDAGIDNDTVYGGDGRDTVVGGDGNDVIDTTSGVLADNRPDQGYPGLYPADTDVNNDRDSVDAGNGDDVIRTGDDADTISAGAGNDTVDAGVDNDVVNAGDGNDNVIGGEGSDTIDAGAGDDMVYGGFGPGVPDSANIPDATDALPNNGRDSISAGDGNDTVLGLDDKDTIDGGNGADQLDGGIDDDSITGAAGDDKIIGGQGADTLTGGADKDLFAGATAGDVVDGSETGADNDTLDLTGAGPFKIVYDPANGENGTVQFLDPTDRHVTGTMTFKNIENVIPCFTPGTLIATPRGEVPVETLRAGDRVITRDNGMQEIRWVGRRDLSWADLAAAPHLKPILIRQGSLGNGLPERDMMVSPNHRVLVANDRTALYFDEREVLVSAKHLVAGKGVHSVDTAGVSYMHFMFDRHEVVLSNGAWTESFQPGDLTLKGMGNAQRTEIFDLFPELKTDAGVENYGAARRTLKRHEAMLIAK